MSHLVTVCQQIKASTSQDQSKAPEQEEDIGVSSEEHACVEGVKYLETKSKYSQVELPHAVQMCLTLCFKPAEPPETGFCVF